MKVRQTIINDVSTPGLGQRIKQARKDIAGHKSLASILREIGLSRTYWHQIEDGDKDFVLSFELLQRIENALGVKFGIDFDE